MGNAQKMKFIEKAQQHAKMKVAPKSVDDVACDLAYHPHWTRTMNSGWNITI